MRISRPCQKLLRAWLASAATGRHALVYLARSPQGDLLALAMMGCSLCSNDNTQDRHSKSARLSERGSHTPEKRAGREIDSSASAAVQTGGIVYWVGSALDLSSAEVCARLLKSSQSWKHC